MIEREDKELDLRCALCGCSDIQTRSAIDSFQYGDGDDAATLTACIRIHSCQECGFEFADDSAEDARHAAVCLHVGVMTPDEIRATRDHLYLSRRAFAELAGFGIASLSRWERGELIQNAANDNLIYLLASAANVAKLKARRSEAVDFGLSLAERFQSIANLEGALTESRSFLLRA